MSDELRAEIERAIDDPGYHVDHDVLGYNGLDHSTDAVMAVVRPLLAARDAAVEQLDRLHSWDGLLELLDEHWPTDIFPMPEGLDAAKSQTRRDAGPIILGLIRWVDRLATTRDAALAQLERYDGQAYEDIIAERDDYRAMWRDREGYLADELARLDQVRALAAGAVEALPGPDDVRTCSMPVAYLLGIKEAAGPVRTLDAAPADEGGGG